VEKMYRFFKRKDMRKYLKEKKRGGDNKGWKWRGKREEDMIRGDK
jgi:hypothetical protein